MLLVGFLSAIATTIFLLLFINPFWFRKYLLDKFNISRLSWFSIF